MVECLFSARIENWKVGNSEEAERGEAVIKLQMELLSVTYTCFESKSL
jgi:hypothetical protein